MISPTRMKSGIVIPEKNSDGSKTLQINAVSGNVHQNLKPSSVLAENEAKASQKRKSAALTTFSSQKRKSAILTTSTSQRRKSVAAAEIEAKSSQKRKSTTIATVNEGKASEPTTSAVLSGNERTSPETRKSHVSVRLSSEKVTKIMSKSDLIELKSSSTPYAVREPAPPVSKLEASSELSREQEKQSFRSNKSISSAKTEGASKGILKKGVSTTLTEAKERKLREETRKEKLISSFKETLLEFTPMGKLPRFQTPTVDMFKPFLSPKKKRPKPKDEAEEDAQKMPRRSSKGAVSTFHPSRSSFSSYGPPAVSYSTSGRRKSGVTVENALTNLTLEHTEEDDLLRNKRATKEQNLGMTTKESPVSIKTAVSNLSPRRSKQSIYSSTATNEKTAQVKKEHATQAKEGTQKKRTVEKKGVKKQEKLGIQAKKGRTIGKDVSQNLGRTAAAAAAVGGKVEGLSVTGKGEKKTNTLVDNKKVMDTVNGTGVVEIFGKKTGEKGSKKVTEVVVQNDLEAAVIEQPQLQQTVAGPKSFGVRQDHPEVLVPNDKEQEDEIPEIAPDPIRTSLTAQALDEYEKDIDEISSTSENVVDLKKSLEIPTMPNHFEIIISTTKGTTQQIEPSGSSIQFKQHKQEDQTDTDLSQSPLAKPRTGAKYGQFDAILKRAKLLTPPPRARSRISGDILVETRSYMGSFYSPLEDILGTETPQQAAADNSGSALGKSEGPKIRGAPMELLPEVTPSTQQIVMMHETLTEHKSTFEMLPVRKLLSTMSYDELCRKKDSKEDELEVQEEQEVEEPIKTPEQSMSSASSYETVSTVSSKSETEDVKVMPSSGPIEDQFMVYFCPDWESPRSAVQPAASSAEERPQPEANERRHTFAEAMDMIDDDALYDVTFTYKLPKQCPFDLNASLAEVRFKCVEKWLTKIANAHYRAFFDSELSSIEEKRVNEELLAKMISLQNKIRVCKICNPPTKVESSTSLASSKSTFDCNDRADELLELSRAFGEAEGEIEGEGQWQDDASDLEIVQEMQLLFDKIILYEQQEQTDGGVRVSIRPPEERSEKKLPSRPSLATLSTLEDGCRTSTAKSADVTWGQYLSNRRQEIRQQLEKLIELLEKKIKKMKTTRITYKGDDNEQQEIVYEQDLSYRSCHCYDGITTKSKQQEASVVDDFEKDLDDDLCLEDRAGRTSVKCSQPSEPKLSRYHQSMGQHEVTARHRLQMYLLGVKNSWLPEGEASEHSEDPIEGKRLLGMLKREDFRAGKKQLKKQSKLKYLPEYERKESLPTRNSPTEQDKKQKQETKKKSLKAKEEVPFKCDCYCDRTSRYNAKHKGHFRPVLNENLWCLRSEPGLLTRNFLKSLDGIEEPRETVHEPAKENKTPFCPEETVEEPDNFKGWLADDDRNLLLLFNRPPFARLDKGYYKHTLSEKIEEQVDKKPEDPKAVVKERVQDIVLRTSKVEASKFWNHVEEWYQNYRKCDKVWKLIDEFEKIDVKAMMMRDLKTLHDEMNRKLEKQKAKARVQVELAYRKNFLDNIRKLRDAYECRIQHRLEAKAKEMEGKKAFIVSCMLREAKEKFKPTVLEHKKRCIEWMAKIRDSQNASSATVRQREAREIALMVDKTDVAERTRRKLIGANANELEEMEKTLREAIQNRDVIISELNRTIDNMTRDVGIWERAVREVLNSFKKFMRYMLEKHPKRAQYFLSLEKLYQLQMDDLIRVM